MACSPEQARENGRRGGRPKDPTSENYRRTLLKKVSERQEALAEALVNKAVTGDVPALKEVHDRVMGKPISNVDITSDGKQLPTPILNVLRDNDGHKEDQRPD